MCSLNISPTGRVCTLPSSDFCSGKKKFFRPYCQSCSGNKNFCRAYCQSSSGNSQGDWSNERVCTQIARRQQTDYPNIDIDSGRATRSWSVMVHAGICQHGRARSSAISRLHAPMCVAIGTQYPHKHHATFTLFIAR